MKSKIFCIMIVRNVFFILGLGYCGWMAFLLCHTPEEARYLMTYLDENLNKEVKLPSYVSNCELSFNALAENLDTYALAHFTAWFSKTLGLHDTIVLGFQSFVFEIVEMSFENAVPSLSECWWDKWVIDSICNGCGILLGKAVLLHFNVKQHNYVELWNKSDQSKLQNLARFLAVVFCSALLSWCEISSFFIAHILWIPYNHFLQIFRFFIFLFIGAIGAKEAHTSIDKFAVPEKHLLLLPLVSLLDFLIILKFNSQVFTRPVATEIALIWKSIFLLTLIWSIVKFRLYDFHTYRTYESKTYMNYSTVACYD